MEEKKQIKISLSTFLLILAIVVIGIMGYFIYNMNTEKIESQGQISKLELDKKSLESKINIIQETIDSIETDNTNENKDTNQINNDTLAGESYDSEGIIEIGYENIVAVVNGKPFIIPISRDMALYDLTDNQKQFYYTKHEINNINSGVLKVVNAYLGLDVGETTYFLMRDGSVKVLKNEGTNFSSEEVVEASKNIVDLTFEDLILYGTNKEGEKIKIAESMELTN